MSHVQFYGAPWQQVLAHEDVGNELDDTGGSEASVLVPIDALKLANSPRVHGTDAEHIRLLTEIGAPLPPILVHRQTMQVIDGEHRVRAAVLRGADTIAVEFFDGNEDAAFILSVQANLAHGLPLSLADRKAAAERVIERHAEWSDRGIAAAVGLSADAVARLRRGSATDNDGSTARMGRDGRVRPIDSTAGRLRASQVLADKPHASLREIAREAGIAVGTARDVRDRVGRGMDPVPSKARRTTAVEREPPSGHEPALERRTPVRGLAETDPESALRSLKNDPSLRFTESGRRLLRWLHDHASRPQADTILASSVPSHCVVQVAHIARQYAQMWHGFAEVLEQRSRQAM
ncbi:ParB/RepB/Spo0J family partition protein [Actinocrispum wychmicini]|uniref:ParB-like chromosome segregation protein Spo0J n=1 Tax=Actinocrispum wychmicini TaxID=1213861 RepID=A0A4R2JYX3_9PSEU|nr:ParB N-terminal domain-containing protein [Actinocrispum wychmicini]TCO59315.1 ParB-like chromosome segregation protein Spo0J [Actinocrispum wychmicini]